MGHAERNFNLKCVYLCVWCGFVLNLSHQVTELTQTYPYFEGRLVPLCDQPLQDTQLVTRQVEQLSQTVRVSARKHRRQCGSACMCSNGGPCASRCDTGHNTAPRNTAHASALAIARQPGCVAVFWRHTRCSSTALYANTPHLRLPRTPSSPLLLQDLQNLTQRFKSKQSASLQQAVYWADRAVLVPAVQPWPSTQEQQQSPPRFATDTAAAAAVDATSLGQPGLEAAAEHRQGEAEGDQQQQQQVEQQDMQVLSERAARLSFAALQGVPQESAKVRCLPGRCVGVL